MVGTGAAARAAGYAYQRLIAQWLESKGWTVLRRSAGEAGDDMTILELPHLSFEVKRHKVASMGYWMAQAKQNAGDRIPVLVMKRHGHGPAEGQWVVLELEQFDRLVRGSQ